MDQPTLTPEQARVQPWLAIDGDSNLRIDYTLNERSLVYDVGGYLGDWAGLIYDRYKCRIEIFEPIQDFVAKLESRFKDKPNIRIHDFGLGGKDQDLPITFEGASSSTFKSDAPTKRVKIRSASRVIQSGTKIDLMKINIEGGEFDLLEDLISSGLIKDIDNIQVQFHIFVSQAAQKRQSLHNQLIKTHYLTYSYPWIWENWRRR